MKKYDYSEAVEVYPLLAYKAGGFFCTLYKEVLREKDFHSVIEYTDSEAIKKGVLDSLGIGAVPLTMVEPYLKSGELEEFPNMLRMDFTIRVIFRKDKLLSRSLLRFLEIAKGQLKFSLELHPMKNR